MGLRDFFSRKEDTLKQEVHQRVQQVKELAKQGATAEEMHEFLLRPDDFHECIGGLANAAEWILPIVVDKLLEKEDPEADNTFFWDNFVREQKHCDEFFFGCEMRTFVIARSWKNKYTTATWDWIDKVHKVLDIDLDLYRKEDWWKIPCWFHLADLGHDKRDTFEKAWRTMTTEDCRSVVRGLSADQIKYYRLEDE